MPYQGRFVQIDFDFLAHRLILRSSDGRSEQFALQPCSVADFYAEVMTRLRALGVDVHIWTMPSEIEGAIPFEQRSRTRRLRRRPPRNCSGASWCRPIA